MKNGQREIKSSEKEKNNNNNPETKTFYSEAYEQGNKTEKPGTQKALGKIKIKDNTNKKKTEAARFRKEKREK